MPYDRSKDGSFHCTGKPLLSIEKFVCMHVITLLIMHVHVHVHVILGALIRGPQNGYTTIQE